MIDTRVQTRSTIQSPAVDVEQFKELLRLDDDGYANNAYLDGLLLAATQYAEQYLRRALLTTEFGTMRFSLTAETHQAMQ